MQGSQGYGNYSYYGQSGYPQPYMYPYYHENGNPDPHPPFIPPAPPPIAPSAAKSNRRNTAPTLKSAIKKQTAWGQPLARQVSHPTPYPAQQVSRPQMYNPHAFPPVPTNHLEFRPCASHFSINQIPVYNIRTNSAYVHGLYREQ